MSDSLREADFAALAAPAILAWRPYPPFELPKTLSQLGGLPLLGSPADWPRAEDGTPLHFLARIDCKDLPKQAGALPDAGLLQFFARLDEEMLWDSYAQPSDYCRVLFSTSPGQPTSPPEDLAPLTSATAQRDRFRLPDEPPPKAYPHWPLAFAPIKSWPDVSYGPPDEPRIDIERLRAAEVLRATRIAPYREPKPPSHETAYRDAKLTLPENFAGYAPFPQAWIFCDRIARHIRAKAQWLREQPVFPSYTPDVAAAIAQVVKDVEPIISDAVGWIQRANHAGLDAPVSTAEAQAFVAFLTRIGENRNDQIKWIVCGPYGNALGSGMQSAIDAAGGLPALAPRIPLAYYERFSSHHALRSIGGRGWLETGNAHQLLGHYHSSQALEVGNDEVLLLQLASDYGVDFMFCDVGEIHFWIDKNDLAARRFQNVRANTQGG